MSYKPSIYLGIDTSCYTTSIAAIDENNKIVFDKRKLLSVSKGKIGLRQSEGVFQHMNNLPILINEVSQILQNYEIKAIAVSKSPRKIKESYMPVFMAGVNFAKVIQSVTKSKIYFTTHQEGHIAAAMFDINFNFEEFISLHLSGGTMEVLKVNGPYKGEFKTEILANTNDISCGQIIDRVGVKLGLDFPSGKYIDELSLNYHMEKIPYKFHIKNNVVNLSGLETYLYNECLNKKTKEEVSYILMKNISKMINKLLTNICEKNKFNTVLWTGGVSSSQFLRNELSLTKFKNYFARPIYSTDNALGVAYISKLKFDGEII